MKTSRPLLLYGLSLVTVLAIAFNFFPMRRAAAQVDQTKSNLPWFANQQFTVTFENGGSYQVLGIDERVVIESNVWWRVHLLVNNENKTLFINPQLIQQLYIP